MKLNRVFIFTTEPFPIGMAATNRIISYAKGLIFHGIKVKVICLRKSKIARLQGRNKYNKGRFEGIEYLYLTSETSKSNFFLFRRIHNFLLLKSLFLFGINNIDRDTGSIYYGTKTSPALILFLVNKLKKGVLIKDESEHPEVRNKSMVLKFIFMKVHFRLFDGFLLITNNLIEYFNSISNKPSIHVPMTVELDRFNKKTDNTNLTNAIVYTGWLHDKKDGINILIESFSEIMKYDDSYHLFLYGPAQSKQKMNEYFEFVKKLGLSNNVHFKGTVPRNEITDILIEAKILVLPRPNSLQAQNGFPTKLGEYLATGNPTIVTRVGEIPNYLKDGISSYIAEPGSVKSLTEKFIEVISDYPKAMEIGGEGKKVAQKNFSNIIQTKKVVDFIEKLGG